MRSRGASPPIGVGSGVNGGRSRRGRRTPARWPWRAWRPTAGLEEEGPEVHCVVAGDREPSDSKSTIEIRSYPFAG
jgi:hypothetical protein